MSITDPRPPPDDLALITIAHAMALMSVSRRTIYNWLEKGLIACERTASGTPRIVRASLTKDRRDQ